MALFTEFAPRGYYNGQTSPGITSPTVDTQHGRFLRRAAPTQSVHSMRRRLPTLALLSACCGVAGSGVQVSNPFPSKGLLKPWRMPIMQRMVKYCSAAASPTSPPSHSSRPSGVACGRDRDVYTFGVYTGRALRAMTHYFNKSRSDCCHTIFGFDSFRGLPADSPPLSVNGTGRPMKFAKGGVMRYSDMIASGSAFGQGAFSVSNLLESNDVGTLISRVASYVDNPRLKLVSGFFKCARGGLECQYRHMPASTSLYMCTLPSLGLPLCAHPEVSPAIEPARRSESLTSDLVRQHGMRPALYVDIDTDIYVSTYQALDWLCANKLLVPGSIIGYDDFKWGLNLSKKGAKTKGAAQVVDGEARAHDEVLVKKYGLKMDKLGNVLKADSFAVIVRAVPW